VPRHGRAISVAARQPHFWSEGLNPNHRCNWPANNSNRWNICLKEWEALVAAE
jgi:hypothetical protein